MNCSAPLAADGVIFEPYSDTTEGAEIYYNCVLGYYPQERIMATCRVDGAWSPNPIDNVCQTGEVRLHLAVYTYTPLD